MSQQKKSLKRKSLKRKLVKIEVSGGVAEVIEYPSDVEVEILDLDNEDNEPLIKKICFEKTAILHDNWSKILNAVDIDQDNFNDDDGCVWENYKIKIKSEYDPITNYIPANYAGDITIEGDNDVVSSAGTLLKELANYTKEVPEKEVPTKEVPTVKKKLKDLKEQLEKEVSNLNYKYDSYVAIKERLELLEKEVFNEDDEDHKCCFCQTNYGKYGNSPYPLVIENHKRCCDNCNQSIVLPYRLSL